MGLPVLQFQNIYLHFYAHFPHQPFRFAYPQYVLHVTLRAEFWDSLKLVIFQYEKLSKLKGQSLVHIQSTSISLMVEYEENVKMSSPRKYLVGSNSSNTSNSVLNFWTAKFIRAGWKHYLTLSLFFRISRESFEGVQREHVGFEVALRWGRHWAIPNFERGTQERGLRLRSSTRGNCNWNE